MSQSLEKKLASVRSRLRRLTAVYGVGWMVAAVLGACFVLGLADYLFRFQDRGIRVLAWLSVLGVLAWTSYRYLLVALAVRWRDVDLARRIERRFPSLDDGLASAVEFLISRDDDPVAGSFALRRAVIATAVADSEPLDFRQAVASRPAWRAAGAALAVGVLVAVVVGLDPGSARTAVTRLTNPFGSTTWPQVHHLMALHPMDRIAKGRPFEVMVFDRYGTRLPAEVRLHYRFENPDGTESEETELMHFTGSAMVARRENVTRSFSYRAEGGDDNSMPWLEVEVLEPPKATSISVKLSPPQYTGWPASTVQGHHIRAIVGACAELAARSTKPLQSASLCLDDGVTLAGRLSPDGLAVAFPAADSERWIIQNSGFYWFEFVDRDGLVGGEDERWDIQAVPDNPPDVAIEAPSANLFITPQATVPLRVAAADDLAIRHVALHFRRSDDDSDPEKTIDLYSGPVQVEAPQHGPADGIDSGDRQAVDYRWDVASLALEPGQAVTLVASATDYLPQSARSEPRRLIVVTPEELADRIASRQTLILAELRRVLEIQRQSRGQVATLEIRLDELGGLDQFDIDHLQGAELRQRQVRRTLTSPTDGVPMHIQDLLADLENNNFDIPDVRRRMTDLLTQIDRLEKQHLSQIGHQLTGAIKAAQIRLDERLLEQPEEAAGQGEQAEPEPSLRVPLVAAGQHQDAVIAWLEDILGQLSRWADYRRFHREISQLARQQDELAQRSADIGRNTLGKELKDVAPQDVARLRAAARDQLELARRLDRIMQDMHNMASQIEEAEPLAAQTISDAVERARQLATSARMQSAGEYVGRNQMGQAAGLHKAIRQQLQDLLDILSNRRESELERLVEKLRQAEVELADLAERQDDLHGQMEEAGRQADRESQRRQLESLRRRQQALQDETERMARRLERLMAQRASRPTQEAAQAMQEAGQRAAGGQASQAAQQADEAKRKLDEALEQLAQERREAESDLATEQLARLEDGLKTMRGRQEAVITETRRLDELARSQGRLSRGQSASVHDLSREQEMLRDETGGFQKKLVGAAVFNLVLRATADNMTRAANLLDARQTGQPTQQAELTALARLDQLLLALEKDEPESDDSEGDAGGAGSQPGGMSPGEALQALAELKLLRQLQVEVNRQTVDLDESHGKTEQPSDDARGEYNQLGREQGRLADLLFNLIAPQSDHEDDLDRLPELRRADTEELVP